MKTIRTLISLVAVTAALGAFAADSRDSGPQGGARRPALPAPWLLVQRWEPPPPTCEMDNRRVPIGATTCREGQEYVCRQSGQWETTRKKC